MKKCTVCLIEKNVDSFSKDKATNDGYRSRCKDCESKIRKQKVLEKGGKIFVNRREDVEGYKTCSSCKIQLPYDDFYKSSLLKDGYSGKCKKCSTEYYKSLYKKDKNRSVILCSTYKKIDLKKGIINDLTPEFLYNNILSKPCFYCNESESNIGCDRIDNNLGHFTTNVVPCCNVCNRVRSNIFSKEEMIKLGKIIKQIKETRISKNG